jgi:hypothetical protein
MGFSSLLKKVGTRRLAEAGSRSAALWLALALSPLVVAAGAAGQDAHFLFSIPEIEDRLRGPFEVHDWRGSRAEGDRTQRVVLSFEDEAVMAVKWANAPAGGGSFNNEPRYEAAAYEIQKLFLAEPEFVVPPTIIRAFPHAYVSEYVVDAPRTFRGVESVLVALQYWMSAVTPENFWDPARAERDTTYARAIGNLNILTYLIHHGDSNVGNFLISQDPGSTRIFSVDNGVAFRSRPSNRGHEWRDILVKRLPQSTVDRLRGIGRADLERALAVIVEFEEVDGHLVPAAPGDNLSRHRGVRSRGGRVQVGLTSREITEIEQRRLDLLRMVDRGIIETF